MLAMLLQPTLLTAAAGTAPAPSPVPTILFYCLAAMVLGAALTVALARNIVRAATGLLFALAGMSGFYFLLNAEFLAAVQLVVYVGGTLILIIFGVMLTSKSPSIRYNPTRFEVIWALLIGFFVTVPLLLLVLSAWGRRRASRRDRGTLSHDAARQEPHRPQWLPRAL